MRRLALVCLIAGCLVAPPARAFTIASGFRAACHERITADAYNSFLLELPPADLPVPDEPNWRQVGAFLIEAAGLESEELTDAQLFVLTSLLVGVRSPDTDGHAVLNLEAVRALHTDPDPEGQYAHALRATTDDFAGGSAVAVAGTRAQILLEIDEAATAIARPPPEQNEVGRVYFDFYGIVDLDVWGPAFHLGRAAHALQDSFSHSIRDEADGFRSILSVLNFSEAVAGTLQVERDGLPHSDSLDSCDERTEGTREAATEATLALFRAFRDQVLAGDVDAVPAVMTTWMTFRADCDETNEYCGNQHWVDLLYEEPTGPYLCAVGWTTTTEGEVFVRLWLAVAALAMWRTRRRRR